MHQIEKIDTLITNYQLLLSAAGATIALLGLFLALRQYQMTQKQHRAKVAAELVEQFFASEINRLALKFIDWVELTVNLPKDLQTNPTPNSTFEHTHQKLNNAFQKTNWEFDKTSGLIEIKPQFRTLDNIIYIETFDIFFQELERINSMVSNELIAPSEMEPFRYWLKKMEATAYNGRRIFTDYLEFQEYDGVMTLTKKIKKKQTIIQKMIARIRNHRP